MDVQQKNLKICPICGRSFSNGKALGGHMKSHSHDSSKETADKIDYAESSNGGTPVCKVCDREFRSWKSLYGHMRSHSERQRRGVMEPPEVGSAATGKPGRPEVSLEIPMDVMEAATILLEIGGNRALVAGNSGEESELNNVIVQGLPSDRKKEKMEDPDWDWDPGLDSGSGHFKCPRCKKTFASCRALTGHQLKHYREGSGPCRVSDLGPVSGNGSTQEVGQMEQIREERSSVEPVRLNQQPWVEPTLSPDAQIPEIKLVIDLNIPAEPEDD